MQVRLQYLESSDFLCDLDIIGEFQASSLRLANAITDPYSSLWVIPFNGKKRTEKLLLRNPLLLSLTLYFPKLALYSPFLMRSRLRPFASAFTRFGAVAGHVVEAGA